MKKKQKRIPYLAGHEHSWIWGRHAVREILASGRWPVHELFLAEEMAEEDRAYAYETGVRLNARVSIVNYDRLRVLCKSTEHQGYLARMGPFPYTPIEEILENAPELPLYLVLDGIRDAHNFGAIIRSAAALGCTAVIAGSPGQTPVNSQTARASAGALNRIPIALEDTLDKVLDKLHDLGVFCIAGDAHAETPLWTHDLLRPAALLLGNEGHGIHPELLAKCDVTAVIPLSQSLDSLNVSAAAAAMLYEAQRQRSSTSTANNRDRA